MANRRRQGPPLEQVIVAIPPQFREDFHRDTGQERTAIHGVSSVPAHKQWHAAANAIGVSLSGLLESLAPIVEALLHDNGELTPVGERARRIDVYRRARGQRRLSLDEVE